MEKEVKDTMLAVGNLAICNWFQIPYNIDTILYVLKQLGWVVSSYTCTKYVVNEHLLLLFVQHEGLISKSVLSKVFFFITKLEDSM